MRICSKPLLVTVGLAMLGSAAWAQATAPGFPAPARAAPAPRAASCHNGANFDRFLADLKQQAVAAGVSQRVFGQVFTEFSGRMAAPYRMQQGQARIKTYAAAFARAEKEYGVPPAVIAAFWGLESDFGSNMGTLPTLRSLVS